MKTPNVLETPVYPGIPQSENAQVGSISRDDTPQAAWLAGIFDGEGTVGINGNNARGMGQLKLAVKTTCPFMIQRISEILDSWGVPFHYTWQKYAADRGKKEQLEIVVTGMRSIRKVCGRILPYLTTKREEAEVVAEYVSRRLELPFHTSNQDQCAEINAMRDQCKEVLSALKKTKYRLQRLPRRASEVLDLSTLEVMV